MLVTFGSLSTTRLAALFVSLPHFQARILYPTEIRKISFTFLDVMNKRRIVDGTKVTLFQAKSCFYTDARHRCIYSVVCRSCSLL